MHKSSLRLFWSFLLWSLEFASDFEIRISDFTLNGVAWSADHTSFRRSDRPVAQQVAQHAASMLEIAEDLWLASQRLGKLMLADREPEDAVRERGADGRVVRQRGGADGLAHAA